MPSDYIYERTCQMKRKALRSFYRLIRDIEYSQNNIPADRIKAVLSQGEITLNAFSKAMNMSVSACHYLVSGRSWITPETAVRLSYVLGGTAGQWLRMQYEYDLLHIKVDKGSLSNYP